MVHDLAVMNEALQAADFPGVSVKQFAGSGLLLDASHSELVRDHDGHLLMLLQR
jgi:hypothetical protein